MPLESGTREELMVDPCCRCRAGRAARPLGFGTTVIPQEADNPIAALALADSRLTGVVDGRPMPRDLHPPAHAPTRVGVLRPAG